jgi:preprotein translocase subunit SecD
MKAEADRIIEIHREVGTGRARVSGVLCVASWTAVAVIGCADVSQTTEAGIESGRLIEFRLVREVAAPNLIAVEYDGALMYLDPEPLLSDEDLTRVEPDVRPGQLILRLEMTPSAGERIFSRTADEVGSRLAVVVDGEVRSAPVVRDAVRGPATVVISASAEEAARLSELVRARWP